MADGAPRSVGVVGVGRMGGAMVHRLLAAGHRVHLFNRTAERLAPYVAAGAHAAGSVGEVAGTVDVVITCVDTLAASERLYLDADGIVAAARASTLLIEHSTITPELAQRIAERAVSRGLHVVDAPVSGGPEGAMQGTLAIMVGGSAAAFARAEGILRAYGRTVVHMGGAGAGMQAKLVSQLLTFAHGAAAAEAVALAQRIGLELGALGEVLRAGFGQSRMLDRTLTRVQEGAYEAGAALVLFDKDLGLLSAMGARHETALPMTDALQAIVHAAIARGLGGEDISALRLQYPGAIRPDPA